jgi:hypothetical protein
MYSNVFGHNTGLLLHTFDVDLLLPNDTYDPSWKDISSASGVGGESGDNQCVIEVRDHPRVCI